MTIAIFRLTHEWIFEENYEHYIYLTKLTRDPIRTIVVWLWTNNHPR